MAEGDVVHQLSTDEHLIYPTEVLSALAEPHRQTVLRLLEKRPLSQSDLVRELWISQPLVSHHLKVLRAADLVELVTQERRRVYRLRVHNLAAVGRQLTAMAERAHASLDRPA